MDVDEGKRGSSGIVASLVETEPGQLRLILDDVKNESTSGRGPWSHHVLFTFKDYTAEDILAQKLSEKELADIGFNLLVRLGVLHRHPIK